MYHLDPGGFVKRHGPADENDFCSVTGRSARNRVAHLAGAAVRDVAHRIDRFAGWSRSNQDCLAREQALISGGGQLRPTHDGSDFLRLQHAAGPGLTAGLRTVIGAEDRHAPVRKSLSIGLDGLVVPHDMIHRRRDGKRRLRRETDRRQEVGSRATGKPRHDFGRRRRDQYHVGPTCKLDVAHRRLGFLVPQVGPNRLARYGLQSRLRDKLLGRPGHHDLNVGAARAQPAHEIGRLVCSDSAGDA